MAKYIKQLFLHKVTYLLLAIYIWLLTEITKMCLVIKAENSYYTTDFLYPIVNYSIFYFLILLVTAVQYFCTFQKYSMQEALDALSYRKGEKKQVMCLLLVHFVLTVFLMGYCICLYAISFHASSDFLWHILINIIVNVGMCGVLALVIGKCLSIPSYNLLRVLLLAGIICITSPIKNEINFLLNLDASIIEIFPENANFSVNGYLGYPIQIQRIAIIAFWIVIHLAVLTFYFHRSMKKIIYPFLCILVAIACLGIFMTPRTNLTGFGKEASLVYSQLHYRGLQQSEKKEAGFSVESYQMELKVSNQLKAKTTLSIHDTGTNKEPYAFTLYHVFEIKRIYNQWEDNLSYQREGDYLYVYVPEGTKEITFEYEGNGCPFYGEYAGIYLPAGLPYYPIAGFHKVYDGENICFSQITLPKAVPFEVHVDYPKTVYSNLIEDEKSPIQERGRHSPQSFSGTVREVMLLSGFVTEIKYEGYRFLFPSSYNESRILDDIKETVDGFEALEGELKKSLSNKVFIWMPDINGADREAYFDDMVMCYMFKKEYLLNWYKEQYISKKGQ
ncbi:MAG: hypothetical protein NC412_01880 [Roseburia sp.]|nr:hypothetical protein [Roseburia sp.]MCM1278007.1 hypothetical protein [Robinsoniella sp.]